MDVTLYNQQTINDETLRAKQRLGIVGNAPALNNAVERAIRVAPIDLSVLVTGESGTGKEFFPRIIHQYSPRKHNKYIAVNCGAIPEGTIDSELFGHEKGAFTGAIASRKGYFEEANGGTIFLDEVAELPLTTQARLLRVLETGEFLKVGSSEVSKTNIRIVAATNVDMAKAVAEGRFREDLFYRLSTVQISVPPLRDRGNDIMLLARKFASDFAEKYRMPAITFNDEARNRLLHYFWPGNVRQLKNVIEQIALFDAGRSISAEDVAAYLPDSSVSFTPALTTGSAGAYERERDMLFNMIFRLQREIDSLRDQLSQRHTGTPIDVVPPHSPIDVVPSESAPTHSNDTALVKFTPAEPFLGNVARPAEPALTLEETERNLIRDALLRNDGYRKAAAAELNISERTLYRKIKEYGLTDLSTN